MTQSTNDAAAPKPRNGLRYALRNADLNADGNAVDQLDVGKAGAGTKRTSTADSAQTPDAIPRSIGRKLDDDPDDVSDVDSVTARNTRANERTKRIGVRRGGRSASSSPESSPDKHVNFIDEAHSVRVLAGHKSALHNPKTSEETKTRAKDLLEFHGESCD